MVTVVTRGLCHAPSSLSIGLTHNGEWIRTTRNDEGLSRSRIQQEKIKSNPISAFSHSSFVLRDLCYFFLCLLHHLLYRNSCFPIAQSSILAMPCPLNTYNSRFPASLTSHRKSGLILHAEAYDKENFRHCSNVAFCRRYKEYVHLIQNKLALFTSLKKIDEKRSKYGTEDTQDDEDVAINEIDFFDHPLYVANLKAISRSDEGFHEASSFATSKNEDLRRCPVKFSFPLTRTSDGAMFHAEILVKEEGLVRFILKEADLIYPRFSPPLGTTFTADTPFAGKIEDEFFELYGEQRCLDANFVRVQATHDEVAEVDDVLLSFVPYQAGFQSTLSKFRHSRASRISSIDAGPHLDSARSNGVQCEIRLRASPFSIVYSLNGNIVQTINERQLLNFEIFRPQSDSDNNAGDILSTIFGNRPTSSSTFFDSLEPLDPSHTEERIMAHQIKKKLVDAVSVDSSGAWAETFKGSIDVKLKGPSSVGIDVSFENAVGLYGISSNSGPLSLTEFEQPYRLYNVDIFLYDVNDPMGNYGSNPMIMAVHAIKDDKSRTMHHMSTAMLWVNASETFVKVNAATRSLASGEKRKIWISSETGLVDLVFFCGPSITALHWQYHQITGAPHFAPLFSFGTHHSRWNFLDQTDVEGLERQFRTLDIPLDSIWLDIEYTNDKEYFTWDLQSFPDPLYMQDKLKADDRYLRKHHAGKQGTTYVKLDGEFYVMCGEVIVIDPHLRESMDYHVYADGKKKDVFVKKPNGADFTGRVWPGVCTFPDYLRPEVREWWAGLYSLDRFPSSDNVFIWNDMNEPSVFDEVDNVMAKTARHGEFLEWEHRDIHNMYGLLMVMGTYEGLLKRSPKKRPFILTRSHHTGIHRFAFVWTGDNKSTWEHMRGSIPMLLSNSIAGLSYIGEARYMSVGATGADVGGFMGVPGRELFLRWHELGCWYPFYRIHSNDVASRREAWLFGEGGRLRIRGLFSLRYRLLPFWYTLAAEYAAFGFPIIQPILYLVTMEDPPTTFDSQDSFLLGNEIIVYPVLHPVPRCSVASKAWKRIYLPKVSSRWYDLLRGKLFSSGSLLLPLEPSSFFAFVRGGHILPTRERLRNSSVRQLQDPLSLHVYLGDDGKAIGRIFLDDGVSWKFDELKFLYQEISFSECRLTARRLPLPLHSPRHRSDDSRLPEEKFLYGYGPPPTINTTVEQINIYGLEGAKDLTSVQIYESPDLRKGMRRLDFFLKSIDGCSVGATENFRTELTVVVKKPMVSVGVEGWVIEVSPCDLKRAKSSLRAKTLEKDGRQPDMGQRN